MARDTDPIATSVWIRPSRSLRGQPTLSLDQIVSAAIELLDAEGLDGMSMRRLGARLGAGATSAYWYVRNKSELLELAIDKVMGEIDIPDAAEVGWRTAAGASAREYRSAVLRHPWMIGVLGVLPAIGPNAMRMSDRMIKALTAAGFAGEELAFASSMLASHAVGSAMTEVAMRAASARAEKSPNELVAELEPYIRSLEADYHSYVALWTENKGMDMERLQDDGFDFGLDRLLDGLQAWLDRPEGRD
ncbi:TetR/AcrR family transcriptional regulator C-terminal domain-containing protein [Actinomadura sp. DC4]|uniref:TetR/AcrR family transcriptional regulator C-terminal domain-containing protein n=1 Tax=Actinomadura sp. DC4 TaxID=3055069 RepID=UPI0025B05572|nr:TetR/AcrR family transcriptional regulator C-terminal domain-containing protein [Actinomadura sp. DC4]MDN3355695.1 TetR/AcrR family transcriptional regulator C-terminal domain-containing protein [Actinomadura sp. DC4]